ncbi:MAG TPA: response regulator [Candidatus Saccharimonadales bacterium]|nr:response regulator [Candidatus Saccharimonadales bacterium]
MKKNIWILDDDESINEVIKIILEDAGFNAKIFSDATSLKKQLKKKSPDLILLDIILSGQSGVAVANELKSSEQTKNIPIILMSANPDLKAVSKQAKVESYISKPFDINYLVKQINKVLTTH